MQKRIAWNTGSGNITLTYLGEGNDTVAVTSDENGGAARQQTIAIQTMNGAVAKNVTVKQAACPIVVGDVKNFAYTGAVQSIELPKGRYKLQCWGAQGGSSLADSSLGITAQAGGKGGYSEGVLTLTKKTTLYIFVGGQGGTVGNGGWNGGGGNYNGFSEYEEGGVYGKTCRGSGGGGTDIALVTSNMTYGTLRTDRSAASLLSRVIVAGGGSGGAMTYRSETKTTTTDIFSNVHSTALAGYWIDRSGNLQRDSAYYVSQPIRLNKGDKLRIRTRISGVTVIASTTKTSITTSDTLTVISRYSGTVDVDETYTATSAINIVIGYSNLNVALGKQMAYIDHTTTTTTTTTDNHAGYAGGGVSGAGYNSSYFGQQHKAGNEGAFGLGANMTNTFWQHTSGAGGGGWYGGGVDRSDTTPSYARRSGGGSGFVNTAANASYRPSGYTGLQLDSGTTTAGTSSFESTSGGRETGHSGNGYARITKIGNI